MDGTCQACDADSACRLSHARLFGMFTAWRQQVARLQHQREVLQQTLARLQSRLGLLLRRKEIYIKFALQMKFRI